MQLRLSLTLLLSASACFGAASLQDVYARMDKAAATFKGFTADWERVDHENFVNSDDKFTGTIAFRKTGPRSIQVLEKFLTENGQPNLQEISIDGTHVAKYTPKTNTVAEDDLGKKYHSLIDAVLLMGLGGTSKELQQDYKVTFGGPETVKGQPATRLLLNPNDPQLAQMFPKIEVWISDDTGIAVQQKLYEKGDLDYKIQTYSNMKFGPVADSQVKLNLPKGVHRERLFH
jgi:outer membrane lipoprotein-sorting protein